MSKIVLYIAASLDGYIARPDGDIAWLERYNDVDYGYEAFLEGIGALIMGSRTYEASLEFGAWAYGDRKTYVATRRPGLPAPEGANVAFWSGPLQQLADEAKRAAGRKDVWHVGGGELATAFLNEGLIDEVYLGLIPTVLGEGIPLFQHVSRQVSFRLVESKSYANGLVMLHYGVMPEQEVQ